MSTDIFLLEFEQQNCLAGIWDCLAITTPVIILFFFFETGFRSCYPGWSAMARSRLTAASTFWAQAILSPQPPQWPGLQAHASMFG